MLASTCLHTLIGTTHQTPVRQQHVSSVAEQLLLETQH